jgi:hypothetical protein
VIGGIDAYPGDEFSKAFYFLQADPVVRHMCIYMAGYSNHTPHVSEALSGNGTRKFSTLLTN